jgi:hypothetical protein
MGSVNVGVGMGHCSVLPRECSSVKFSESLLPSSPSNGPPKPIKIKQMWIRGGERGNFARDASNHSPIDDHQIWQVSWICQCPGSETNSMPTSIWIFTKWAQSEVGIFVVGHGHIPCFDPGSSRYNTKSHHRLTPLKIGLLFGRSQKAKIDIAIRKQTLPVAWSRLSASLE